jgi:hypothetical protein
MGVSSDGILVYGVDLGEEIPAFLEEYDGDFNEYLENRSGLPKYGETGHDFGKHNEYPKAFPIDLTSYCSYEYPMHILSVRGTEHRAYRGYTVPIKSLDVPRDKVAELISFCAEVGIENPEPSWLLVSMYG